MAKCRDCKTDTDCPHFLYANSEDIIEAHKPDKTLDLYCVYCKATPKMKKIAHSAFWTGSTPKWCPLGRDE